MSSENDSSSCIAFNDQDLRTLDVVQTPIWFLGVEPVQIIWGNAALRKLYEQEIGTVLTTDLVPHLSTSIKEKHQEFHCEVRCTCPGGGAASTSTSGAPACTCPAAARSQNSASSSFVHDGVMPHKVSNVRQAMQMSRCQVEVQGQWRPATLVQVHPFLAPEDQDLASQTAGGRADGMGTELSRVDSSQDPASRQVHDYQWLQLLHTHSPIFTMLFTTTGELLKANLSALSYYGTQSFKMSTLLDNGQAWMVLTEGHEAEYWEGSEGRKQVLQSALSAIARKEHVRIQQKSESRKHQGETRWSEMEMWPLMSPVAGGAAVLVNMSNITRLKETEQRLRDAHDQLRSRNTQLTRELEQVQRELAEIAAPQDVHLPEVNVDIETPVEKALKLLDGLLEGQTPSLEKVEELKHALTSAHNLQEPLHLGEQLMELVKDSRLDDSVAGALVDLLQDKATSGYFTTGTGDSGHGDRRGRSYPPGTMGRVKHPDSMSRTWGAQDMEILRRALPGRIVERDENEELAAADDEMSQLINCQRLGEVLRQMEEHDNVPELAGAPGVIPCLLQAEGWLWDPFKLEESTKGRPLSTLTMWLFERHGLCETFQLNTQKLMTFLREVEKGYPDNPYHNRTHAADVVQTMNVVMQSGGLLNTFGGGIEMMAGLLAAAIHDYEHKGLNNDFLIRSRDPLSILYNDRSPMENWHLSGAFQLMYRSECFFVEDMHPDQVARLRQLMIEMVLATDMKNHFQILNQFKSRLEKRFLEQKDGKNNVHRRASFSYYEPRDAEAPGKESDDGTTSPSSAKAGLSEDEWVPDDADRSLALQVALKIADIGHLVAGSGVHLKWVANLEEEFFQQGDLEKKMDMTVSFLMDRDKPGVTKSQLGFFDIVIFPLIRAWANVFPSSGYLLERIEANYMLWRDIQAQEQVANEQAHM